MLIRSQSDYENYLRTAKHLQFERLNPHFSTVETNIITQYFGISLLASLNAKITANTATAEELYLIELLKKAIASLGMVKAIPSFMVDVQATGLNQAGKDKPLFEWQKLNFEDELLETGYNAIGDAINYLYANRNNANFSAWKNSAEEANARRLLFNSTFDFQACLQIANSTRTFEALKPSIKEAIARYIKPILGTTLLLEITNTNVNYTITGTKLELLKLVREALAQYTMAIAIYKLELKFNEEGARVVSISSSSGGKAKVKTPADMETKDRLADRFIDTGDLYSQSIQEFLIANNLIAVTAPVNIDNSTGVVVL